MSEEEVIPVHKDSWNSRELLQRVISRHCHVLEDIGGRTPTYLVAEKENEDMHEVLITINQHLEKLSYSARLYPDDPWILQLIPHTLDPKPLPPPKAITPLQLFLLKLSTPSFTFLPVGFPITFEYNSVFTF